MVSSIYDIVNAINNELEKFFKSCNGIKDFRLYGIANTVNKDDRLMPEIDQQPIGIDDKYDVTAYHKLTSFTSAIKPDTGMGRNAGLIINTYGIGMVLFLEGKRTGINPDALLIYLQAYFPERLIAENINSVVIQFTGGIFDSRAVYGQEYANSDYRLDSGQYLLRANYNVQTTFDKRCFKIC